VLNYQETICVAAPQNKFFGRNDFFFIAIIIYASKQERVKYFPELKTGKIEPQRVGEISQPEDWLSPKLEKL